MCDVFFDINWKMNGYDGDRRRMKEANKTPARWPTIQRKKILICDDDETKYDFFYRECMHIDRHTLTKIHTVSTIKMFLAITLSSLLNNTCSSYLARVKSVDADAGVAG